MSSSSIFKSRGAFFAYGALLAAGAVVATFLVMSQPAPVSAYNVNADNVAIEGYDTVSYFTDGKPVRGSNDFEARWEDARWLFSSAANRDLFQANPERYAPQYGGYCAGGVAVGEYASADPEAWKIVDGKLYLIHSKDLKQVWDKAPEAHIEYAEYNWSRNRDRLRRNL